jgi:ABC-type transport system substrate-binding protein
VQLRRGRWGGSEQRDEQTGVTGTPKRGDRLTFAMETEATSVNPATVNIAFVNYTLLAYEPLIYRASDGDLEPAVATSWEMGDGNATMSLELREGVTFTDGSPVDAAAVKASLEYARDGKGPNAHLLANVEDIEVAGPDQLTLHLSSPNPMLPEFLTQSYGIGQVISPTGVKDPSRLTADHPSQGAGAYVFDPDESVPGDHYTYTANPDYYAKDERQHYDEVVIRVINDQQARMNALTTGQIDLATGSPDTIDQAADQQVVWIPFVWQGLSLIDRDGAVSKPLGDVRVRQAINHAIDREEITKALLGEYGVPTDTIVVEGAEGWSEEAASRYPFDVDKAKSLMADAGYEDGFELDVLSIRFAGIDVMAEAIAPYLAEIGIEVKLNHVTDEQSYVQAATDRSHPAMSVGYGAQPMYLMGQGLFLPGAGIFNGFQTERPELTKLYEQAAGAEDDERQRLNQEMVTYLTDEAWFAPVAFGPVLYVSRPDLGGVAVSPNAPVATPLDWYDLGE